MREDNEDKTKWKDNPVSWGSFLLAILVALGAIGTSWMGYEKRLASVEELSRIVVRENDRADDNTQDFRNDVNKKLDAIQAGVTTTLISDAIMKSRIDSVDNELIRIRERLKTLEQQHRLPVTAR